MGGKEGGSHEIETCGRGNCHGNSRQLPWEVRVAVKYAWLGRSQALGAVDARVVGLGNPNEHFFRRLVTRDRMSNQRARVFR